MDDTAPLMRSLVVAIEVGGQAEGAISPMVQPPQTKRRAAFPFSALPTAWWQQRLAAKVGPDQVRVACELLDEFAVVLADISTQVPDVAFAAAIAHASEWSDRLWATDKNASHVYNEVREVLARLDQYRVNAILDRPLSSPPAT
jgi:hypothetical protein